MRTKLWRHGQTIGWTVTIVWLIVVGASVTTAIAQHDRDRYHSPHWEFDVRHNHDHFYPALGYVVPSLPPGSVHLLFGGDHFYFRAGVWFRANGPNFVVVSPPPGIAVSVLPPTYTTIWIRGVPYYYANNVYYTQAQGAPGYMVVAPPPGYETAVAQPAPVPAQPAPIPAPPSVAPPSRPSPGDGLFVYPRGGQTQDQLATDRSGCDHWGADQTGYDPIRGTAEDSRRSDFQRAVTACLEGRGYTVK